MSKALYLSPERKFKLTIANRLQRARLSSGLTTKDVAEKLGEPHEFIKKHESGDVTPRAFMLCRYADIYHVSVEWLCGRTIDREGHHANK